MFIFPSRSISLWGGNFHSNLGNWNEITVISKSSKNSLLALSNYSVPFRKYRKRAFLFHSGSLIPFSSLELPISAISFTSIFNVSISVSLRRYSTDGWKGNRTRIKGDGFKRKLRETNPMHGNFIWLKKSASQLAGGWNRIRSVHHRGLIFLKEVEKRNSPSQRSRLWAGF